MTNTKVLVIGASGLLGRALVVQLLKKNYDVYAVVRSPRSMTELPAHHVFKWDALSEPFPEKAMLGMHAVVNLIGEPVAESRWNEEVRQRIYDTRILSTKKIVDAISATKAADRPKVFLSGSAIGIYADSGYLAELTREWEKVSLSAERLDVRVVQLRTGIVLSRLGGALPKMGPVVLGSGTQWMSWIHVHDWCSFVDFSIQNSLISGAYNLTAPNPVTNSEFTDELVRCLKYPFKLSVPKTVLKVILGEMPEVLLASQKVLPDRLLQAGFSFQFPHLKEALNDIYRGDTFLDHEIKVFQFVPQNKEQVFPFFSAAENLEKITPPWLNFKIVKKSTEQVQENTLIDYKLKIHGFPARWQSKIVNWEPGAQFVDFQTSGPYSKWHHTHTFESVKGGTLLGDRVSYRVPGHFLGKFLLSAFIKKDVTTIFQYRQKIIESLFGK